MINDPTPLGLAISFGYLAALLAALIAWRARASWFWMMCAMLVAAFGINQQLDLQSWAIELGRGWVRTEGLYAQRRAIQAGLVALAALGAAALALPVWRWSRAAESSERLGACGLALIVFYALVRLAAFSHLDPLGLASRAGNFAAMIEIAGLALIVAGGLRARLALG